MLGRHIYRVSPAGRGWSVVKEGGTVGTSQAGFHDRKSALAEACRLAESDKPSRVIVDDGDGKLLEEHLFGSDLDQEIGG